MLRNTGPAEGCIPNQQRSVEAAMILGEREFKPSSPTPLATSLQLQTAQGSCKKREKRGKSRAGSNALRNEEHPFPAREDHDNLQEDCHNEEQLSTVDVTQGRKSGCAYVEAAIFSWAGWSTLLMRKTSCRNARAVGEKRDELELEVLRSFANFGAPLGYKVLVSR